MMLKGGPKQPMSFRCFKKNVIDRIFQIDHDSHQQIVKQKKRDYFDSTSFLEALCNSD